MIRFFFLQGRKKPFFQKPLHHSGIVFNCNVCKTCGLLCRRRWDEKELELVCGCRCSCRMGWRVLPDCASLHFLFSTLEGLLSAERPWWRAPRLTPTASPTDCASSARHELNTNTPLLHELPSVLSFLRTDCRRSQFISFTAVCVWARGRKHALGSQASHEEVNTD